MIIYLKIFRSSYFKAKFIIITTITTIVVVVVGEKLVGMGKTYFSSDDDFVTHHEL